MAHNEEIRDRAERLYVEEALSVTEIAQRLGIPAQTIYRWLAAVKGKEGFDWNEKRKNFALSPQKLVDLYAKALKRRILEIQKNIDIMDNPETADAISRHISTLKKLDPRCG